MISRLPPIWLSFFCLCAIASRLSHASCDKPDYVDTYGIVNRLDLRGVNACPYANPLKPLFTRTGTLACASLDGYNQATEIRDRGWFLAHLAGAELHGDRSLITSDGHVPPQFFGCTVLSDGLAATLKSERDGGTIRTNLGWMSIGDLRNSPESASADAQAARSAEIEAMRPRLCQPDGSCVYTDVKPRQPVPHISPDPRFFRSVLESVQGHEFDVSSVALGKTEIERPHYICTFQNGTVRELDSSCPDKDFFVTNNSVHTSLLARSEQTGQRLCSYEFYLPEQLVYPYGGANAPNRFQIQSASDCPNRIFFVVDKTGDVKAPTPHQGSLVARTPQGECAYHVVDLNLDFHIQWDGWSNCPNNMTLGVVPRPLLLH